MLPTMAEPVPFARQTEILKPDGSSECHGMLELPVRRDADRCVSCWRFDEAELAEIMRTKCIYVYVFTGKTPPPMAPSVREP